MTVESLVGSGWNQRTDAAGTGGRIAWNAQIARQQQILRAVEDAIKALPKDALEFGNTIILPNPESGFEDVIVKKKKP